MTDHHVRSCAFEDQYHLNPGYTLCNIYAYVRCTFEKVIL